MRHNAYLYLVVAVAGAAVLTIEILGTRILGPFYGVSVYLWSALITVTLAALGIGYAAGGRLADKRASMPRLCSLVAAAGAWLLLIPLIRHPVLLLAEPLSLRFAVLAAAVILFAAPLILLGMVSPYAIKLKTTGLDRVGRTAGDLYALSTFASVVSALLTGFFLIPNVGVTRLLLITGVLLLATAVIGFLNQKKPAPAALGTTAALVLGGLSIWLFPVERARPGQGLIAIKNSAYAELRVLDTEDGRHLLIDGGIHAMVDTTTGMSNLPYVAVMELPKCLFDSPGRMLLIGLGGGSLVKSYRRDGWSVTAAEIDRAVSRIAYQHFRLDSTEAKVYNMDGRLFLITHPATYDVILLDAFGSSAVPFHLITAESFSLMASRLRKGGILAVNLETVGWNDILVRSTAATLRAQFTDVLALPMAEPPDQLGNVIVLAANRPLELHWELERNYDDPEYRFSASYHRSHAWDNQFVPDTRKVPVLSDDLNPVDTWSEAVNQEVRKKLHSYFGQAPLSW